MSLKVWLPLNGDLTNNGIIGTDINSTNTAISTSGKIGSCYTFNGSSSYILLETAPFDNTVTEFTYACWFKPTNVHQGCLFSNRTATSSTGITIFYYTSGQILFDAYDRWQFTPSTTITAGEWNHLVFTYKKGEKKRFYLNGTLINETTASSNAPTTANATKASIGGSQTSSTVVSGNWLNGALNDVRIYDHCLSAAEVHKISQGLILHYKLDQPNPNILSEGIFEADPWKSAISAHEVYYGRLAYRVANNTLYQKTSSGVNDVFAGTISYEANTQYTLSVTWRDDYRTDNKNSSLYLRFNYTDGSSVTNMISPANTVHEWVHQSITSNAGKTVSKITTTYGNGGQLYLTDLKLEKGTIDTGVSITNNNVIIDSSGYNNNGTIVGTCTAVESPPRYSAAISMNNTSTTNHIETANDITFSDNMSVSFWVKSALSNQVIFASKYIEFGILNSLGYVNPSASAGYQLSSYFTANAWNHICVVKNAGTFTLYVNGQKPTRNGANNNYLHNVDKLWILNRSYNSSYGGNGSVSDFRFYVTPLGDDDVLELYHTSMSIDKLQNIHTLEFEEQDENVLAGIPWTSPFSTHSDTQNLFTNYNSNGEPQFTANSTSAGTKYIEITPGTYYYDTTISVNTGNQFYIGFERYDANKTARENQACAYIYTTKPSSDVVKQRYKGTVNLSTDGTNTLKYITLRILNGWSGTTSGVTGQATVHNLSLRLVSDAQTPKIKRTGEFVVSELKEDAKSSLYKNDMVEAAEFIER